ncbi:tRNA (uridine(34)/cytosine(34)/5-carboxymethylaminomethyluridine(34)-2'-O)-methyltransferase TrmL [Alkalicoccus urumqiensis]|uniref:Putative tRNA (cytidine(34)-2'-O)-methyltransferase n=1 Tax=Alkalicoccus urumqiensis TaxID=1548213 RepID=A0A2P6MEM1_ALKUR|nr:tRNA (uridine(34)/cytosine(34)/5-carboxymethylaminomethyluridine(34)-2'-O)-methyltransferase TrmL [Alkalicoccus urumqiensis]PRO64728.1 tRNA (uridine(34)/cytosine(34)/5-carboxymethylaminomethyluridine(34)-2'-O)-methyltransferase TrmL [Alkalicoccus urumqiensis]
MGIHVVLFEPEIPANTGNIARTCAGTNASLHLIHPLGFSTDDRMLKRAGCDYWPHVDVHHYDSLEEVLETWREGEFYFVETTGTRWFSDVDYSCTEKDYFFVFGKETTGLPEEIGEKYKEQCLLIPQTSNVRSLNLSNTAAILVYEAARQQQFASILQPPVKQ